VTSQPCECRIPEAFRPSLNSLLTPLFSSSPRFETLSTILIFTVISQILCCLSSRKRPAALENAWQQLDEHSDSEKDRTILRSHTDKEPITKSEAVKRIVDLMFTATEVNATTEKSINDVAHQAGGWNEWIAKNVVAALEEGIRIGRAMSVPMGQAYKRAEKLALDMEGFAHDNPVLCTVIAFGILVLLAPFCLEWLGFGALGPIEGISPSQLLLFVMVACD